MTKFILTVTIAAAALAAGLCFDMPASRASYRDAPWCLVKSGGEDSYWDCEFKTFQECLQARAGISFCNVNPSGRPVAAAPGAAWTAIASLRLLAAAGQLGDGVRRARSIRSIEDSTSS